MRALVTGGAGYIGGSVAARLVRAGHDVVVVDNLSTSDPDQVPHGVEFHQASVGDAAAVSEVLSSASFDVCLHFAGLIAAGESMEVPERYLAENVGATLVLVDQLVRHGVAKLVFSSSAAVYGEPRSLPIDEEHPTAPVSAYGASKLLVEEALSWCARLGRLRYAALRYYNASGADGRAERHRPETHLIPLALDAAAGLRDALDLYGDDYPTRDGTCVRDYVHVADLADAHVLAIDALDVHPSLVCNLGTGTGSTNAEVLRAIKDVTGLEVPVRRAPRRPGDPAELVASNARAREVLGWTPVRSSLAEIVADAWASRSGAA